MEAQHGEGIVSMLVILFRGAEEWKRLFVERDPGMDYSVPHCEMYPANADYLTADISDQMMQCWCEVFKRHGSQCPNCQCLTFYSTNYMESPEWLRRQEFDKKYGWGEWGRAKRRLKEAEKP